MSSNDANDAKKAGEVLSQSIRDWLPRCWHELALDHEQRRDYQEVIENVRNGRKYRPQNLLLVGPKNTGGKTFANFVARCIFCYHYSYRGACGFCQYCRKPPYNPDLKKLEEEAAQAKSQKKKKKKKKDDASDLGEVQTSDLGEVQTSDLSLAAHLCIHVRGIDLTQDGLRALFKKTKSAERFRLMLIEGLDDVPQDLQQHLYSDYMDLFHGARARVCWLCTAQHEERLVREVLCCFPMAISVVPPSSSLLFAWMNERCREWGIRSTPDQLRLLLEWAQEDARAGELGRVAMIKEVLARAAADSSVLTGYR